MYDRTAQAKQGFTLVELLVVITIIGILASLSTVAVIAARTAVIRAMVKTQMGQVDMALDQYKSKYGEYPPSLADQTATMRHVANRWKRASGITYTDVLTRANIPTALITELTGSTAPTAQRLKEIQATIHAASLPFWFGGVYDSTNNKYVGFRADLTNPMDLDGTQTGANRYKAPAAQRDADKFYDLNEKTVAIYKMGPAGKEYDIPCLTVREKPLVYFRSSVTNGYGIAGASGTLATFQGAIFADYGVAVPYAKSGVIASPVWYNADKYQLVYPGFDDSFGDTTRKPAPANAADWDSWYASTGAGVGVTYNDLDNQTNFGEGATLDGEIKQ